MSQQSFLESQYSTQLRILAKAACAKREDQPTEVWKLALSPECPNLKWGSCAVMSTQAMKLDCMPGGAIAAHALVSEPF